MVMDPINLEFNEDLIRNNLKVFNSHSRISFRDDYLISSAVLFLIVPNKNLSYEIVLIRRAIRKNDKHSGEIGFPGSLYNPQLDSSYKDTALRETEEELGIPRGKIHVLGCIDDVVTPKGYVVTPFVGYIEKQQKMVKCDEEVQEIIKIPISFFADKKNYREKIYTLRNQTIALGRYNYKIKNKKYVIFGATSHMIANFIDLIYNYRLMKPGARRISNEDLIARDSKSQTL